jgi:hypothetical protein
LPPGNSAGGTTKGNPKAHLLISIYVPYDGSGHP